MEETETKIILASGSPRRRELLTQIGIPFEVRVSEADESMEPGTGPEELVKELSRRKAQAVLSDAGEEDVIVLGADTVVALDGRILGKPGSAEEACRMLRSLSGRTHQVYTGVTILRSRPVCAAAQAGGAVCPDGCGITFAEETDVTFAEMTDAQIRDYVDTGDPLDKAGAYGIQGYCARYITGIKGDYYNVVGLPVAAVYAALSRLGCAGPET